ncbi:MAG: phage head-tail connector protein [Limnohabitans sp.]
MAYDLATAKTRLGIVDPTKDALLTSAMAMALSFAETYCNRKFMEQDETETLIPVRSHVLHVRRYPIATVTSVTLAHNGSAPASTGWHVDKDAGLIYVDSGVASHEVTVAYHGGYAVLPPDLEFAMYAIFDSLWLSTPGWGAAAGGVVSTSGQVIQSITVPDVGTIRYDTSGAAQAASSGAGALGGAIPTSAAGILNLYRREYV